MLAHRSRGSASRCAGVLLKKRTCTQSPYEPPPPPPTTTTTTTNSAPLCLSTRSLPQSITRPGLVDMSRQYSVLITPPTYHQDIVSADTGITGGLRSTQTRTFASDKHKEKLVYPAAPQPPPRDAEGHADASPVASHAPPTFNYLLDRWYSPSDTKQASPETSLPATSHHHHIESEADSKAAHSSGHNGSNSTPVLHPTPTATATTIIDNEDDGDIGEPYVHTPTHRSGAGPSFVRRDGSPPNDGDDGKNDGKGGSGGSGGSASTRNSHHPSSHHTRSHHPSSHHESHTTPGSGGHKAGGPAAGLAFGATTLASFPSSAYPELQTPSSPLLLTPDTASSDAFYPPLHIPSPLSSPSAEQYHSPFLPYVFRPRPDQPFDSHPMYANPRRIYIIRHGEAWGNVDESVFERIPDSQVPITPKGYRQARKAGRLLRSLIGCESVEIFCSPYARTLQTAEAILAEISQSKHRKSDIVLHEDSRIREQDFGNLQRLSEITRNRKERGYIGAFYYRFPGGESGSDVYNRISQFQDFLQFTFSREQKTVPANVIIVTHGMTLRLFLMKYFRWDVGTFHNLWNPINCKIAVLERVPNSDRALDTGQGYFPYSLLTPLRQDGLPAPDPFQTLERLFTRKWGDPLDSVPFSALSQERKQEIIREQGLTWPTTSGAAATRSRGAHGHGHGVSGNVGDHEDGEVLTPYTFHDRASVELRKKMQMLNEEKTLVDLEEDELVASEKKKGNEEESLPLPSHDKLRPQGNSEIGKPFSSAGATQTQEQSPGPIKTLLSLLVPSLINLTQPEPTPVHSQPSPQEAAISHPSASLESSTTTEINPSATSSSSTQPADPSPRQEYPPSLSLSDIEIAGGETEAQGLVNQPPRHHDSAEVSHSNQPQPTSEQITSTNTGDASSPGNSNSNTKTNNPNDNYATHTASS